MILLYFFVISAILSATSFFIKNRILHTVAAIIYLLLHISVSLFAYLNINTYDSIYFKFDSIATLMNGLLSFILLPILFQTHFYLKRHVPDIKFKGRFIGLILLLSTALSSIYFTDNIVLVWVSLEITTVAVTFLVYHERYKSALEASWKYLFISSFGITIAFIGLLFLSVQLSPGKEVSLVFTNLLENARYIDSLFLKAAFLLLLTGYSIKMNIFPLYSATVDAKTVAPFPVNALTSTALVNAGFIAIYRIFAVISNTNSVYWANHVMLIVGMISLLLVSMQMFRVKRFKRMYAFSTMEHMALVIIALTLGPLGVYAAILHIVLHTLTKTGIFLHFGQIRAFYKSGWFKDTGKYMKYSGFSALVFIFGLLTVTAIPPSGMFYSEFLIFQALFAAKQYLIAIVIMFLLSIIIFIFFKNSMQLLYGEPSDEFEIEKSTKNNFEPISQIILFGMVLYLAYFPPSFLTELINSSIFILK